MPAASPRPAAAIYGFLKDPANWTHWASDLDELRPQQDGL